MHRVESIDWKIYWIELYRKVRYMCRILSLYCVKWYYYRCSVALMMTLWINYIRRLTKAQLNRNGSAVSHLIRWLFICLHVFTWKPINYYVKAISHRNSKYPRSTFKLSELPIWRTNDHKCRPFFVTKQGEPFPILTWFHFLNR